MIGTRDIDGHQALTIGSADGQLEAAFVPEAGMVCCSLRHRGQELLGQRHGLRGYIEQHSTMGIPLLYPWANRLSAERLQIAGRTVDLTGESARIKRDANGLPMHGLLTAAPEWRVTGHADGADGGTLSAALEWEDHSDLMQRYPFPHSLELSARIAPGRLTIELTVKAGQQSPVPVAFGFHPYLALPAASRANWRLELPLSQQLLLDPRGLPSGERAAVNFEPGPLGERTFDDLYLAPGPGQALAASDGSTRVAITMDRSFPYAQIYAPAGEELIALEPMTAATDALVAGSAPLLEAGASLTAGFSIQVES